ARRRRDPRHPRDCDADRAAACRVLHGRGLQARTSAARRRDRLRKRLETTVTVAFVTGGASGIGAATARRLAADGMRVAVADIDGHGAEVVAKEVDGFAVRVDITDASSVRAGVAAAEKALGPIDVLVNNAGGDRFAFFVDTDEASWDAVLDVNLKGAMACTHAVLPGMYARRQGV